MPELDFTADPDPSNGVGPIPGGDYAAKVVDSDIRFAKNSTNRYVWLVFEVIDGPYKGRRLYARLNLWNASPQAVEIARRETSQLCGALDLAGIKNTEELHEKPLIISVRLIPAGPDKTGMHRDASNDVVRYSPLRKTTGTPSSPVAPWGGRI